MEKGVYVICCSVHHFVCVYGNFHAMGHKVDGKRYQRLQCYKHSKNEKHSSAKPSAYNYIIYIVYTMMPIMHARILATAVAAPWQGCSNGFERDEAMC